MKILKLGSRGHEVLQVQIRLNLPADGIFGRITETTVEAWQRDNGLTPDGIVGPKTWEALFPTLQTEDLISIPMHAGRVGPVIKPRCVIWHYTAMLESTELALAKVWNASRGKGNGATFLVRRNGQIIQLCDIQHNSNHAGGPSTGRIYFTERGEHPSDGGGHHPNSVGIGVELSNPGRVRRGADGWRLAYTGADVTRVSTDIVVTDEALGLDTKRDTWGWCAYTDEQKTAAKKVVALAREVGVVNENVIVVRKKIDGRDYGTVQCGSMELGHNDLDPSRKSDPGPLWRASDVIE